MTVVSIRYQPIEGGALGGHFALHVTLGGEASPGVFFDPTALATKLHDAYESLDLQFKAIRGILFDCRKADINSEDMTSLLGTIRDWGFKVILWIGESIRFPWFEIASYITVFVTSQHWPNFRVNEIRYVAPAIGDTWIEPDVYDVNANASSYIIPGASKSSVLPFITACKRPWGIVGKGPAIEYKLKDDK